MNAIVAHRPPQGTPQNSSGLSKPILGARPSAIGPRVPGGVSGAAPPRQISALAPPKPRGAALPSSVASQSRPGHHGPRMPKVAPTSSLVTSVLTSPLLQAVRKVSVGDLQRNQPASSLGPQPLAQFLDGTATAPSFLTNIAEVFLALGVPGSLSLSGVRSGSGVQDFSIPFSNVPQPLSHFLSRAPSPAERKESAAGERYKNRLSDLADSFLRRPYETERSAQSPKDLGETSLAGGILSILSGIWRFFKAILSG